MAFGHGFTTATEKKLRQKLVPGSWGTAGDLAVLFKKNRGQSLELRAGKATEYVALNGLFCGSLRKKIVGSNVCLWVPASLP